jgi:hypothetical protein
MKQSEGKRAFAGTLFFFAVIGYVLFAVIG